MIKNSKGENLSEWECATVVGEKIRKCRKAQKMTIEDLAIKCAVDYSQVSRMERGRVNFTYFSLLKIASALDIDPKELQP